MATSSSTPRSGAIQALRALAITAVFVFHLNSKWLPNGYLGVDIFFVISGYLMTSILTKSGVTVKSIKTFFMRRIKRILPLYLMTIFSILVVGRFILMAKDIRILSTDSLWSLGIVSNMQSIFHTYDYFEELTSYKLLTHTWSLSVELQYYLIVPLIMFVLTRSSPTTNIVLAVLLTISSWSLMKVLPVSKSFGLLPCRVWQFGVGLLVYQISQFNGFLSTENGKYALLPNDIDALDASEKGTNGKSHKPSIVGLFVSYICYLATVVCCVTVTGVPEFDRVLATLMAGSVIFCSTEGPTPLLDIKPLQYIGDISYVFYLAHWPIITFLKYVDDETEISPKNILLAVAITTTISVVVHHTLEEMFIIRDLKFAFICIVVCYTSCFAMIMLPVVEREALLSGPQTHGNSIKDCHLLSHKLSWPKMEVYNQERGSYVKYGEQNGNGTFDVALIGNSFMREGFPWFYKAFAGRYKRIYAHGFTACLPFIDHSKLKDLSPSHCDAAHKRNLELVERVHPRILMISVGYANGFRTVPFTNGTGDLYARDAIAHLQRFSNMTDYILIDTPLMQMNANLASRLQKNVEKGQTVPPRNQTRFTYRSFLKAMQHAERRLEQITRNCPKCHFLEIQSEFCDGEFCDVFDYDCNKPLYTTDGIHMTPFAYNRIYHRYKAAIDDLLLLAGGYKVDK